MNVPCERSTPKTSTPVSVCVSKWTMPTGPRAAATARTAGSVIEWSPPSTNGQHAGGEHLPDGRLDRGVRDVRVGGDHRRVAEVDDAQLRERVDLRLEVRAGRAAGAADRARRQARARAVGDEVVHRRADDRDVEARELRRVLRVDGAAERQQPEVVGLLAVLRPALLRVDHRPSRTLIVSNFGSLAPCSRAPLAASSRRYATVSALIRSPGSSAGTPGG